jgi:hypothetical protein
MLFWNIEVTSEDEDEMIKKVAQMIHKYGLDVPAILMIETFKPLSFVGANLGRFFVSPFLPTFGNNLGVRGEKFFEIFEKRENVEKLIKAVEDLTEEAKRKEEAEKIKRRSAGTEEKENKKWWQRFLP